MSVQHSFSLEEANKMLPEIRSKVKRIVRTHRELRKLLESNRPLLETARKMGSAPVPANYFRGLERLQADLSEVGDIGIQVKDLETGLIDFPTIRDGRTVLLCWRLGENQVGYWHEVDAGYAGRQPVDPDLG